MQPDNSFPLGEKSERKYAGGCFFMPFGRASLEYNYLRLYLRYQGTPNDNIAFSPFERQAFHKDPNKLYIF